MDWERHLKQVTVFAGPLAVTVAITRLSAFWHQFDVVPWEYVEITELILLSFEPLILTLALYLLLVVIGPQLLSPFSFGDLMRSLPNLRSYITLVLMGGRVKVGDVWVSLKRKIFFINFALFLLTFLLIFFLLFIWAIKQFTALPVPHLAELFHYVLQQFHRPLDANPISLEFIDYLAFALLVDYLAEYVTWYGYSMLGTFLATALVAYFLSRFQTFRNTAAAVMLIWIGFYSLINAFALGLLEAEMISSGKHYIRSDATDGSSSGTQEFSKEHRYLGRLGGSVIFLECTADTCSAACTKRRVQVSSSSQLRSLRLERIYGDEESAWCNNERSRRAIDILNGSDSVQERVVEAYYSQLRFIDAAWLDPEAALILHWFRSTLPPLINLVDGSVLGVATESQQIQVARKLSVKEAESFENAIRKLDVKINTRWLVAILGKGVRAELASKRDFFGADSIQTAMRHYFEYYLVPTMLYLREQGP